jgi:hypothetical protein
MLKTEKTLNKEQKYPSSSSSLLGLSHSVPNMKVNLSNLDKIFVLLYENEKKFMTICSKM